MISITEAPPGTVFSRGDTWVKLFAGESLGVPYTSLTKPTNYVIEIEFLFEYVYNSGTFTSVVVLDQFVNSTGEIEINVKNLIHSEFMASYTEPPLPPIGDITAWLTDNIRKYKLRAREVSGADFTPGTWMDIGTDLRAIFGGITVDRSIDLWDPTALTTTQKMFSWMPDNMMLGIGQPQYITVYGGGAIEAILIGLYDNVLATFNIFHPGTAANECATYYIGTELFDDSHVANAYKMRLEFSNGQIRTFYLDHYRKGKMDLLFINGFGAAECLRVTGDIDESLQIQRDKSDVIRRGDTPLSVGDVKQYASSWDDEYLFHTGLISEGECQALKDMLVYNFLFRLRDTVYEALDITSDNVKINSTGQYLKSLEFNAVRAVKKKIMPTL